MKIPSQAVSGGLENLPDRIRRVRRIAKVTQAELARSVGVSASAVAQWEQPNGTRPGISHLIAVSRLAAISLDWLATGEGKPRRASIEPAEHAISPDMYACDLLEESLLFEFRKLSLRARRALMDFIHEFAAGKRTPRKRG